MKLQDKQQSSAKYSVTATEGEYSLKFNIEVANGGKFVAAEGGEIRKDNKYLGWFNIQQSSVSMNFTADASVDDQLALIPILESVKSLSLEEETNTETTEDTSAETETTSTEDTTTENTTTKSTKTTKSAK